MTRAGSKLVLRTSPAPGHSLNEARIVIEQRRRHYNTKRPHSALGYRPPAPESIIPMEVKRMMH